VQRRKGRRSAFYFPTEVYPRFGIEPFTTAPKVAEPPAD
jgi:hypothetical protein